MPASPTEPRYRIVTTRGGVRALHDTLLDEIMHPSVGPLVESEALYVTQSRLRERLAEPGPPLVVYDVGLGAGSNAAAAWRASQATAATGRRLHLVSFEHDLEPLRLALVEGATFGLSGEPLEAARALLMQVHQEVNPAVMQVHQDVQPAVMQVHHVSARTDWRLLVGELPSSLTSAPAPADLVYWDPYSPAATPALWTVATFTLLRSCLAPRALLFTYSASTTVRAALLLAGFAVGVGDSTGNKAETTVAAVERADLERPLDGRFAERLARSSAPLPIDAPVDAHARIAAALAR